MTDDDRVGQGVERLIRAAGFQPVKVGGIEQSTRLEVGGDLHELVIGPAEARSLIGGVAAGAAKGQSPSHSMLHATASTKSRDVLRTFIEPPSEVCRSFAAILEVANGRG